jgi:hypothetical protein
MGTSPGHEDITYIPSGSATAIVGTATLSAGGSAPIQDGQTISLAAGSTAPVLIVNGITTTAIAAAPLQTGAQIVTIGSQAYTAQAIPVTGTASAAVVLGSYTVLPGAANMIGGETVSLSGTQLIIASGAATSTLGLDGAIMSGISGGDGPSVISYTGEGCRSSAPWLLLSTVVWACFGVALYAL